MPDDPRPRVLALLRQYGFNATSFQSLEEGFDYWFDTDGDACVAYADTGRAWVAAGAPICTEARLVEVANRFVAAARQAGRRAAFFAAEARLCEATGWPALVIGEQPVWDARRWDERVRTT